MSSPPICEWQRGVDCGQAAVEPQVMDSRLAAYGSERLRVLQRRKRRFLNALLTFMAGANDRVGALEFERM